MSVDDDIAYWALTGEQADRYRVRAAYMRRYMFAVTVASRLRLLAWLLCVLFAVKAASLAVFVAVIVVAP